MLEYEIDPIKGYEKMFEYKTTTTTLRPCEWRQYNKEKSQQNGTSSSRFTVYDVIEGHFHSFSVDSSEDGANPVAIVEDTNGNIHLVYPTLLRFTDRG